MPLISPISRDVLSIRLAGPWRVVTSDGVVPYLVVDADGCAVEPIERYLRDFLAQGNSVGSVRSYAYDLQRWWRFLSAIDVAWDRATSDEVRDFVLWIGRVDKARRTPRTVSAVTAGQVNPVTRKQYPGDRYQPRTIRHSNAVLHDFYEFFVEIGQGPLVNPVRRERVRGSRPNTHHNPLRPFRPEGRLRYNPKIPKARPRAMPDECWVALFAAMRSNRDRAILALAVSSGARASELLGVTVADLDWGDQTVRVRRKGSGAEQWLPASAEAFVWLRLYLDEVDVLGAGDPVWWTLRRRSRRDGQLRVRPLNYEALRGVMRRANAVLGTNWTMHDFRHTAALRMVRSSKLSLRDVQAILGHKHLTTTEVYLIEDDEQVISRVRRYLAERENPDSEPAVRPAEPGSGYDQSDLTVLFGGGF